MYFILAITPIILILVLMIGFRWGAARAGGAGYLTTLFIATIFFGSDIELLAYAHARALLLSIDVLLIIWAAFLLYRVADEAGAIATIGQALPRLTTDRGMQALIIGWVFASFLQGVGGFGVPVAVIAPILVGLNFPPLMAVVVPSIGHGWAVTFGSLGSSFNALLATTNLSSELLAPPAALFLGIAGLFSGWLIAHVVGGTSTFKHLFLPILILGIVMGIGQYLAAVTGLWNIAAFLGASIGLLFAFPIARKYRGLSTNHEPFDWHGLGIAVSCYLVLVIIILLVQLVPGIKSALSLVTIQLAFPQVKTSLGFITPAGAGRKISVFSHAGALLFYASTIGYLIYRKAGLYQPGSGRGIIVGTVKRVMSSSISIASMVAMAVIMENSGMTDTLARGLSEGMGSVYPVVAPWIGAIGAFMTGSNTNSNVVFGALQLRTAEFLGYPAMIILAGQTAGAALASVMAPTKVVVGASTAGMDGHEGEVMRVMIRYTLVLVVLISILTLIGVKVF